MEKLTPRRFPRFATDVACRFRTEGTFQWQEGELVNLSKGGVCLKAKSPPAKDETIELEMDLLSEKGEWRKRRLRAKVIWKRGKRAGLGFLPASKF
ncbi:MAG: PilZ domain-containing protein [Deltaproteobacteria bacterium]|jgi:hypothetical protein|nr:PilZ domain-containing protein [Deltaproteobacteria bacterium]